MKDLVFLVGSPAFLRQWTVLGCPGKEVPVPAAFEALDSLGTSSQARVVLYEEKILEGLTSAQIKYFRESAEPYWIPLPPAEGGEA